MRTLTYILTKLPDSPGVYLFYNGGKEMVYVGKATSLKDRVRSYFASQKNFRPIEQMIHEVTNIKWVETDSVLEAIILEGEYIKKYLPKYNVEWKDDKSWNYIAITKDMYPRVITIRQREYQVLQDKIGRLKDQKIKDSEKQLQHLEHLQHLFGPYPGLNTRAMMKLLQRLFYFSVCTPHQKRPCLYRQMGQCLGVCTGEISAKEYRARVIRPLAMFLRGKKKQVIKDLEKKMKAASKAQDFEDAARLRNQIGSLQRIQDIALLNRSFVSNATLDFRLQTSDSRSPIAEVHRIEGYDISNLGSTGVVGSMVVFTDGEPDKSQYRKFKIKTVEGQSDVDCLDEVLRRRLNHAEWPLPNLFLIDGGKPQINRVKRVLAEARVARPIVGIAKGPERKKNDMLIDIREIKDIEEKQKREFIRWVERNKMLLIRVRDEAHRFAIAYQRKLRRI